VAAARGFAVPSLRDGVEGVGGMMTLQSAFGSGNKLAQIPVVFSPYCEKGAVRMLEGVIYAHSPEDLLDCLDRGLLRSMGIVWP
jgi:hypothetical protein